LGCLLYARYWHKVYVHVLCCNLHSTNEETNTQRETSLVLYQRGDAFPFSCHSSSFTVASVKFVLLSSIPPCWLILDPLWLKPPAFSYWPCRLYFLVVFLSYSYYFFGPKWTKYWTNRWMRNLSIQIIPLMRKSKNKSCHLAVRSCQSHLTSPCRAPWVENCMSFAFVFSAHLESDWSLKRMWGTDGREKPGAWHIWILIPTSHSLWDPEYLTEFSLKYP
jgi:hypothetical protein